MKSRPLDPVLWLLFSGGGMAAALLIPVLLLIFGVAIPLGWVAAPDHAELSGLVRHPITRLVLAGFCVLALFHAAHRLRHTLHDGLQLRRLDRPIELLCYGAAVAGSALAAYILLLTG